MARYNASLPLLLPSAYIWHHGKDLLATGVE